MKILIVCGGDSTEREVSINTGKAVLRALGANFEDTECFICRDRKHCIESILNKKPDVVFIALHGGWGENGELQASLDMFGIKYTGSNFEASSLSMNKFATKSIIKSIGIPTAKGMLIKSVKDIDNIDFYPVCLKPNQEGSSVGVEFADNIEETKSKALELLDKFKEVIVEEKLIGKELTVTIVNGKVFPLIEIRPKHGFYDYKNKYTKGSTDYLVPAPLDKRISELCKNIAKAAYDAIGCSGCARVDLILQNNVPYILEINTMPGMTETSLVPKAVKAAGMSFEELVKIMVNEA